MKTIDFKFKLPGKKDAPADGGKASEKKDEPADESKDDEGGSFTRAELGKAVASAIRSGDGESIYEAVKRLLDTTPSDAE